MAREPRSGSRWTRGLAHAAWAVLAFAICLFLALTRQTGHPPPIALVPYVAVAWVVGHGIIQGVQLLAARGRRTSARAATGDPPWPVGLRVALLGTGVATLLGVIQLVGTAFQRKWYPFSDSGLWLLMLCVWLAHAASFAGLLLRKRWSSLSSGVLASGWAMVLAGEIAVQLTTAGSKDAAGLLVTSLLIVALLLFAAYLARSRTVTVFLDR